MSEVLLDAARGETPYQAKAPCTVKLPAGAELVYVRAFNVTPEKRDEKTGRVVRASTTYGNDVGGGELGAGSYRVRWRMNGGDCYSTLQVRA